MMFPFAPVSWPCGHLLAGFAGACAFSLALALLLALGLRLGARRWPALAAHRSVWLLAQLAVALGLLLPLAPARLSFPIALPQAVLGPVFALPESGADGAGADNAHDTAHGVVARAVHGAGGVIALPPAAPVRAPAPAIALLRWLPPLWLGIYLAGLAWQAGRRLRAARRWRSVLLRHSQVLDGAALRASPLFTPEQRAYVARAGLAVRTTALPLSPLLLGLRRPCLLLPAQLAALAPTQQRLVVEHELTHWRRADPLWLAASGLAALLFWFNRPFRQLAEGLREAVELGCDDAVLAGRGQHERQGYAAALVAQLSLQLDPGMRDRNCAAPAFGQLGVSGRQLRMRESVPPRLPARARAAWGCGALGLAVLASALQPAFSAATPAAGTARAAALPVTAAVAPEAWRYPLAAPRVTSLYGVRSAHLPVGHHGIDFAARRGAPVLAVAGGTVTEAGADPTWGNYVRIAHGAGRASLVIHLERIAVARGQQVLAGDAIGTAGASGKASGPHLHLAYWQDGRRRDPALMLADLSSHASAQALARRQAQGNPVPTDE